MIIHYIILGSSYLMGKRIALDYYGEDSMNFKADMYEIFNKCGEDVSISYHCLVTSSESWKSVSEKDPFFKDVKLIDGLDKFINLLKADRILSGFDVAKYILSKIKCTHLKLEKLTYLCYADYLCETGKRLFHDDIYAFKYGPVVESVYENCKRKYGYLSVEEECFMDSSKIDEMPSKSRLFVAEDGFKKCVSIDNTLEKYGKLSAGELVDITHRPNSPWCETYNGTGYEVIEDDTILKFHKNEIID